MLMLSGDTGGGGGEKKLSVSHKSIAMLTVVEHTLEIFPTSPIIRYLTITEASMM